MKALHPALRTALMALVVASTAAPAQAQAQTWPTRSVRIVASFPPGTPGDVIARLIQPGLQAAWGQPVVIDNKAGAGGNLAAAEVAQAKDDHTLLVGPDTVLTLNPHLYRNLNFGLRESLKPVTYLASFNQTLVCGPSARLTTLAEFARQPAERTYASGGMGTPSHMAMEMLLATLGLKLAHVPYKGPGPAANDVMAGQVDCGFIVSSVVLPHLQSGRLKGIAVSGLERSVALPELPTVAETGYKGFDATFFETLMVPTQVPRPIVEKIQRDVRKALTEPAMQARLAEMDLRVVAGTPDDAVLRSAADHAKWGTLAKRINLRLD